MKRALVRFRNSKLRSFIRRHEKAAPIVFFIGGFIFDSLTLGRIDRLYDLVVLSTHMTLLTLTIYLYNVVQDGKFRNTLVERYQEYFPLAIQFFFGGLSSAYVIYFSRSVSLSKTVSFFIILVLLLLANEVLKRRISNKYLQFSIYFFLSFTFFTFMVPVFIKEMNTEIFIFSGLASLTATLGLIAITFRASPSTRAEIQIGKLLGLILSIYALVNVFYFFKLIPPVPLALNTGIVAHNVTLENNKYVVSYERDDSFVFWREHNHKYSYRPGSNVYIFSSIFAPTDIKKSVLHRWKWYDGNIEDWVVIEDIGYEIAGGRDGGYRGYTYKNNVKPGKWRVEVITEEELVLGVIDFEIVMDPVVSPRKLIVKRF